MLTIEGEIMYGKIIREIRLNKGLALKEVYAGICSKTNAIKFEKGERNLAVDKFSKVLENLMITFEEFKWIKDKYQPTKQVYYQQEIKKFWNENNIENVEKKIQEIESNNQGIERIQIASFKLLKDYDRKKHYSKQELGLVVEYFSKLSQWTIADIKFFANNCYVIPYQIMLNLLTESLKVSNRYKYFQNSNLIFATVITNCVERMIWNQDYDNARKYLKVMKNYTSGSIMIGYKLMEKYYEAELEYLDGDAKLGRKQLIEVKKTAKYLDAQTIIRYVDELIG